MLRAARALSDAREADDEVGPTARLITALQKVAMEAGPAVTPTDLFGALQAHGFGWLKTPRALAGLLAPLGLVAARGRVGERVVRRYALDPGTLADLASRYNPVARVSRDSEEPAISLPCVNKRQQASTTT